MSYSSNNSARRRTAKRLAREAEYEREWSLDAEDRRRREVAERRDAIQANNQRIVDGQQNTLGITLGPRHLRRRPLQQAWKERNSK